MTLHISESEVRAVLTMPMAIEAVEDISRKQANGEVVVHPRRRFELPGGGFFHYMAAADFSAGFVAMKQYTYVQGKIRFMVPLYEMKTGDLLAMIEADYMGQLRTGAASGVATKVLSRQNSRVAAIIGTGGQARTQLEAVAAVRKLESARVFGRDIAKREKFSEGNDGASGLSRKRGGYLQRCRARRRHPVHRDDRGQSCRERRRSLSRRAHQCHRRESRAQTRTR